MSNLLWPTASHKSSSGSAKGSIFVWMTIFANVLHKVCKQFVNLKQLVSIKSEQLTRTYEVLVDIITFQSGPSWPLSPMRWSSPPWPGYPRSQRSPEAGVSSSRALHCPDITSSCGTTGIKAAEASCVTESVCSLWQTSPPSWGPRASWSTRWWRSTMSPSGSVSGTVWGRERPWSLGRVICDTCENE